jgi:hypothetical protein
MEVRAEMRWERRWIPAFAGMTSWRGGKLSPETQRYNPSRQHRVIPAKAGIHGSRTEWSELTQRNRVYPSTNPNFTGRSLTPLFSVIPAKAGIHASHAFRRRRNENADDGNNNP